MDWLATLHFVTPTKVGVQLSARNNSSWIPAFAGMTMVGMTFLRTESRTQVPFTGVLNCTAR